MKSARLTVAAAFLLAAFAGCSLFLQTATLIIQNNSSFVVDKVYIVPVGSPDWGVDWLSTTILPGRSHAFHRIDPGTYDVLIGDTGDGWWPVSGLILDPGAEITLPLED
jgi:hypothetical protein